MPFIGGIKGELLSLLLMLLIKPKILHGVVGIAVARLEIL